MKAIDLIRWALTMSDKIADGRRAAGRKPLL